MQSINNNAPVICTKSIVMNAGKEKVWSILTSINEWASWQKEISYASLQGSLAAGSSFTWKTGGAKINSKLHTVEPYSQFGWTGKTFGLFAIHNWTLKENNQQTEVTVDESMEGFLASVFKKSFNKNLEKGMMNWLQFLKQKCEE